MEAVVILLVPLVALAVYLSARFQAGNVQLSPQEELTQLRERLAWHEDRLRRAKEKNFDDHMTGLIADQLDYTRSELARVSAAQAGAAR